MATFYKYTGKKDGHYIEEVNGVDVLRNSTRDGFSNLDIAASRTFFSDSLSLTLGAKNVLDVTDIETLNQMEQHMNGIFSLGKIPLSTGTVQFLIRATGVVWNFKSERPFNKNYRISKYQQTTSKEERIKS